MRKGSDASLINILDNSIAFGDKVLKFDVVCGNPPYNNDMYLDFVMLGHSLAKTYDLWITPAKFNFARKNAENHDIWQGIIRSMENCVFYQNEGEVFSITMPCGISYYLCSKKNSDTLKLTNKSKHFSGFNHNEINTIKPDCFNINAFSIISKIGKKLSLDFDDSKEFKVYTSRTIYKGAGDGVGSGAYYSKNNFFKGLITNPMHKTTSSDKKVLGSMGLVLISFDSSAEADNFISFMETKLVRYLIGIGVSNYSNIYNDYDWRFVPDPGSFNRVFEDAPLDGYTPDENGEYTDSDGNHHCSLYVKYKLTEDEINVIESVIRERK